MYIFCISFRSFWNVEWGDGDGEVMEGIDWVWKKRKERIFKWMDGCKGW